MASEVSVENLEERQKFDRDLVERLAKIVEFLTNLEE
jgi:hypothetical protein